LSKKGLLRKRRKRSSGGRKTKEGEKKNHEKRGLNPASSRYILTTQDTAHKNWVATKKTSGRDDSRKHTKEEEKKRAYEEEAKNPPEKRNELRSRFIWKPALKAKAGGWQNKPRKKEGVGKGGQRDATDVNTGRMNFLYSGGNEGRVTREGKNWKKKNREKKKRKKPREKHSGKKQKFLILLHSEQGT